MLDCEYIEQSKDKPDRETKASAYMTIFNPIKQAYCQPQPVTTAVPDSPTIMPNQPDLDQPSSSLSEPQPYKATPNITSTSNSKRPKPCLIRQLKDHNVIKTPSWKRKGKLSSENKYGRFTTCSTSWVSSSEAQARLTRRVLSSDSGCGGGV